MERQQDVAHLLVGHRHRTGSHGRRRRDRGLS
jgi:hypothetical protein